MMKIVLGKYPDGMHVPEEAVKDILGSPASYYKYTTEITHNGDPWNETGDPACWDVDVYARAGGLSIRIPDLSKTVNRLEMLSICMEAAPGDADLWIDNLMSAEDAQYVKRHYYNSPTFTEPRVLRA